MGAVCGKRSSDVSATSALETLSKNSTLARGGNDSKPIRMEIVLLVSVIDFQIEVGSTVTTPANEFARMTGRLCCMIPGAMTSVTLSINLVVRARTASSPASWSGFSSAMTCTQ